MYHDVAYRNDELRRELEQASQKAARGWRFRHLPSGRRKPLATVTTILGSILVAAGQWLAERGRSSLATWLDESSLG